MAGGWFLPPLEGGLVLGLYPRDKGLVEPFSESMQAHRLTFLAEEARRRG